jgi:arginine/lysine/ornithine decarboxylase
MDQSKTPLFDALLRHQKQESLSFHVPGHKNGDIVPKQAESLYKSLLSIDVTELTGLDDLHSPDGVIKDAENLLANAYNSLASYFLINGSTVGNLAMILSSFIEGDIVFVQRNCHKSILNGLKLAKLKPIFIEPDYNMEWKVATGITKTSIELAFQVYPEGKGVILTYPNYYGFTYNIEEIIDFCHLQDMVVLVDEAHGAHFIAGEPFPLSALQLGADIVVQSAHKTLPAMTMAAFLHINSDRIPNDRVRSYLQVLQSSSPSYPLMASLDIARSYIATYSEQDKFYFNQKREAFIQELKKIPTIKVLSHPPGGDPLKIVIQSKEGISGFDLQKKLELAGVYAELADPYNVLLVLPLLKSGALDSLSEAISRIKATFQDIKMDGPTVLPIFRTLDQTFSSLSMSYTEQLSASQHVIAISNSIGCCSAEMVIPYPPGIPLLMEGEEITKDKVEQLQLLVELGSRFHGGEYLVERKIKVYKR